MDKRVIAVMDIMGGVVVAGRGGGRDEYAPATSIYLDSPDPFHFVERFSSLFGFTAFYVADLDSIMRRGGNGELIASLVERAPFSFIVDGGYAHVGDAPVLDRLTPVFATESFLGWDDADDLSHAFVSMDMKWNRLVSALDGLTVEGALARARDKGCWRFMHLRMDAVGEKNFDPRFLIPPGDGEEWVYGGGVRSPRDMIALHTAGYAGALVSTALRDGTFWA